MSELTITGQGEVVAEEIPLIPNDVLIDGYTEEELESQTDEAPFVIVQGEDGVFHKATDEELVDAGYTITDDQGNTVEVGMTETKAFTDPADAPKKLNPAKAYDSEESLQAYDRETIRLINEEAEEVKHFEREYDEAADVAKECKKSFEKAEKALRELIEERKNGRGKPQQPSLYKDPESVVVDHDEDEDEIDTELSNKEASTEAVTEEKAPDAEPEPKQEPVEDNSWRDVPLSSLSLTPKILKALADPIDKQSESRYDPILTVGDLSDFTSKPFKGRMRELTFIRDIGPGAAEKIGQASTDFFAELNRKKAG